MNKKKYSGYKSYQYLEAGKDYKTFKLAKQVKRVAPYELELTEAEQKRVEKIFDENFVISAHEHPRILPEDIGELTEMNSLGREYTGYEGLSVSGMDAVFDNFLDGSCIITSKHGWKWNDILYNLGMKYCDVAHQDMYVRAENVEDIKKAKENGNDTIQEQSLKVFRENFQYFGYGFLNNPKSIIPNVPLTFYSFHIMVALGFYFVLLFMLVLYLIYKNKLETKKWLLRLAIFTIPLAYIASMSGWIVAEVGRQPWTIQDLLPTVAAVSNIDASAVQITFWLFAIIFTALLIAEIKIMTKQIKIGPKEGGH